ncbi:unnamed protein product [Moneuplotes crassus]|uniref:Uncharacterized protein n=1 Tax=Euplotes crassus TaxID=5936 RepID=A0AAD1UBC4_EUPCR|nr:unnamed protein product [Moneuplotes crassus]
MKEIKKLDIRTKVQGDHSQSHKKRTTKSPLLEKINQSILKASKLTEKRLEKFRGFLDQNNIDIIKNDKIKDLVVTKYSSKANQNDDQQESGAQSVKQNKFKLLPTTSITTPSSSFVPACLTCCKEECLCAKFPKTSIFYRNIKRDTRAESIEINGINFPILRDREANTNANELPRKIKTNLKPSPGETKSYLGRINNNRRMHPITISEKKHIKSVKTSDLKIPNSKNLTRSPKSVSPVKNLKSQRIRQIIKSKPSNGLNKLRNRYQKESWEITGWQESFINPLELDPHDLELKPKRDFRTQIEQNDDEFEMFKMNEIYCNEI